MKKILVLLLFPFTGLRAQPALKLTLDECRSLAVQHYPLAAQQPIFKSIMEMDIQNIRTAWMPRLSFNAQATYQSDVTALPVKLPQMQIPELSKDQYRATLDLHQQIYDGGSASRQAEVRQAGEAVEEKQLHVQLYQLRQQVDNIYLNILFLNDNIELAELRKADLRTQINKVAAMVKNGVSLSTNLDVLQAELLNADQQETVLHSNRRGLLKSLSVLTGRPVGDSVIFVKPVIAGNIAGNDEEIRRPEMALYAAQKDLLVQQSALVGTRNIPRLNFFAQGGYGKPGLNMLENKFRFYYITGIQLSMPVYDWKQAHREKGSLLAQQSLVDLQKQTFVQNTALQLSEEQADIEKYKTLALSDQELVSLRTRIKNNAASQLQNGVITANDYLTDLNAENQALLNQRLHELQLLMAEISYQTTFGN